MKMNIFTAYNEAKKSLKSAGIEPYSFEARQIIKHITDMSNSEILSHYSDPLTPLQQTIYNNIIERRCKRYPLQYMLGEWSFYGLDFFVGEGVLIPRCDTEILVDTALELLDGKPEADVLDLCSGSGCVAVAIAEKAEARVTAVEKYDTAFGYLIKNIERYGNKVEAVKGDIFNPQSDKKYDLIVSNPPYVSAEEMGIIDTETTYEPDTALYGGEDGLMFYRAITQLWKTALKPGGKLAFEVGFKQAGAVVAIMTACGYTDIEIRKDLEGNQRVVFGTLKAI